MIFQNRKVILLIILAAVSAGCAYLYSTLGRAHAFVVTSQYSADYCTALLAAQDDTTVFVLGTTSEREIWDEINHLGITDLYVVSDPNKPFESSNHTKRPINVHHIDPLDGVSASVAIARMARKESDTVFIADVNTDIEVMAGICSASAYSSCPILLTDAQSLSPEIIQFLQECKCIAHAYLIGDTLEAGITSELERLGLQVYAIRESDPAYINGMINRTIVADADNLSISFHADEMLAAANMCVRNNSAGLFVPDTIADSQEMYVTTHSFDNITSTGEERPEIVKQIEMMAGRAVIRPFYFKDTGCNGAVFYVPHQDDETLFFSQAIMEAVSEFGAENVYAVLVSDGAASYVQRREPVSNYLNEILDRVSELLKMQGILLSESDRSAAVPMLFSQARTNEYLAALTQMGITNVEIYYFPDGGLPEHIPQIKEIISSYEADNEKGNLIHFTFSPYYETHNDHKAIGQALDELYQANSGSFENVRFIVKNEEQFDIEFMNAPNHAYDTHTSFLVGQSGSAQIRAASEEYGMVHYDPEPIAQSIANLMSTKGCTITEAITQSDAAKQLRLGIGILSVRNSFEALNMRTDHGTRITTLHEPFVRSE